MSKLKSLAAWLRLFPSCLKIDRPSPDSHFFHSWQELWGKTVDRVEFLLAQCQGKRVLHFGFVDAPFSEERIKAGSLLHQRLRKVTTFLYGADIDAKSLDLYRRLTGDTDNAIVDVQQKSGNFEAVARDFDLVLFPEVLEHLLYPADALANLRQICRL